MTSNLDRQTEVPSTVKTTQGRTGEGVTGGREGIHSHLRRRKYKSETTKVPRESRTREGLAVATRKCSLFFVPFLFMVSSALSLFPQFYFQFGDS